MENTDLQTFPLEKIGLDKLKLYPKEYQFRLGQAASGEVESHKIQGDKWEPLLHGAPIYVHKRRDANGAWEVAVVDGHHRVNFAKRLAAEGKLPADFKLDAFVLEEEKGINTETAKIMLAYKDIALGRNSPIESALVLKEAKEHPSVRQQFLPQLQLDKGNLKLAVKFSGLSDRSLHMIADGDVPVAAATQVLEQVKDPARIDAVMQHVAAKLKQDYPNYVPNHELAQCLVCRSNDNQQKSWAERTGQSRNTSMALGV
ncbi:MAG: hypothetical protein SFX19_07155 [Alphaproteobacteria bacterium]|nr:hypothetical protein [Alphaproteobacteria bacterium]